MADFYKTALLYLQLEVEHSDHYLNLKYNSSSKHSNNNLNNFNHLSQNFNVCTIYENRKKKDLNKLYQLKNASLIIYKS